MVISMENNQGKRIQKYVPDYVVFDLETTGISVKRDAIIEISAVKVTDHKAADQFSTLVNPGRPIPAAATAVNGITDKMVAGAPDIEVAISSFLDFIGDGILVGHNIHTFDMPFIYGAAGSALSREIGNEYIDTLYMARKCLPELSHHKLTDIAGHFGFSTKGAHRALQDCIMNQQCYEELGKLLENTNLPELLCPACGSGLRKRSGKFGEFYGCGNFPLCRFTRKI